MIEIVVYAMLGHREPHLLAAIDQGGRREIEPCLAREYDEVWDAVLPRVRQDGWHLVGALHSTRDNLREQGEDVTCLDLLHLLDRFIGRGPVDARAALNYALHVQGVSSGAA